MNNLKRFTVCKLAGHKWAKVAYPPTADGGATGGGTTSVLLRR